MTRILELFMLERKEIAAVLKLSIRTVEWHIYRLKEKVKLESDKELLMWALSNKRLRRRMLRIWRQNRGR